MDGGDQLAGLYLYIIFINIDDNGWWRWVGWIIFVYTIYKYR